MNKTVKSERSNIEKMAIAAVIIVVSLGITYMMYDYVTTMEQLDNLNEEITENLSLTDDSNPQEVFISINKGLVIIDNLEPITPKTVHVILGINNTVTWINNDDTAHSITPDHRDEFFSGSKGVMKPGDRFTYTFTKEGVYDYHGQPGSWLTGTVIVR